MDVKAEGHMPRRGSLLEHCIFPSCRRPAQSRRTYSTNRRASRAGEGKVQESRGHVRNACKGTGLPGRQTPDSSL